MRFVHGDKELVEKLGRNDPCPCGSGRRFQAMLSGRGPAAMVLSATTTSGNGNGPRRRSRAEPFMPTRPPASP
ncbi:MAG: SEC-C metal-binding domain-containing protein [Pseudomonadota bacterium]